MKQRKSSRHRKRVMMLQGAFLVALGAVLVRMQVLQHVFGPGLLAQAKQTQDVTRTVIAPRGEILDAQGQPLAYDVPAYMMDVKIKDFTDKTQLVQLLASALQVSQSSLDPIINRTGTNWVRYPNSITEIQREAVQKALQQLQNTANAAAKAAGKPLTSVPLYTQDVTFTPTEQRVYPFGDFAANVLGYVDHKGVGQSGLELEYNKLLSGTNGQVTYVRDGDGFPIQSTEKMIKQARPGDNIQTTIDGTIQGYVEEQMNALVSKYKPQHAAIIVANPKTGAILGMSSRPTFNPNQYWNATAEALSTNWAVNSTFEPGSTFKVLTLAAGLATNTVNLSQKYMSGHMYVAGTRINDWKLSGWGKITFRQAMEYSSNVGFATIALRLGWNNLLDYMKAFGYLSKTGIDLPNEAHSIIFSPQNRGKVELATSGFGQGIAVTPIQQIAGVGAIANGGSLMKPFVVSKIMNPKTGKVVRQVNPTVVNPHVVPPNIAATVSKVMMQDVSQGIDNVAAIKGYDVAGKTGTAQIEKPQGGYYANRYIVSFIGYAPQWDPQVEVYVTVYWPKTAPGEQWGSTVSAPVARNILKECMQYYHIAPRGGTVVKQQTGPGKPTAYVQTPDLRTSVTAAKANLKKIGLQPEVIDTGKEVTKQWPAPGIEVPKGSKMYLYAPAGNARAIHMPNLKGVSLREAGNILATLGLQLSATGSGFATSQSVAPGTTVQAHSTIQMQFSSPPAN